MNEIEKAIMDLQEYIGSGEYNGSNPPIYLGTANMAISALGKQIPKKPFEIKERHNFRGDVILKIGNCPTCKNNIDNTYKFCKHCGQVIDWSVKE